MEFGTRLAFKLGLFLTSSLQSLMILGDNKIRACLERKGGGLLELRGIVGVA